MATDDNSPILFNKITYDGIKTKPGGVVDSQADPLSWILQKDPMSRIYRNTFLLQHTGSIIIRNRFLLQHTGSIITYRNTFLLQHTGSIIHYIQEYIPITTHWLYHYTQDRGIHSCYKPDLLYLTLLYIYQPAKITSSIFVRILRLEICLSYSTQENILVR